SGDPEHTGEVDATCFAFNRIDPIDPSEVPRYRPDPPPIAKGYASSLAVCRQPGAHAWELVWSSDGTAVVLLRDGDTSAVVSLAHPRGLSKAIGTPGPWGHPWSDEAYEAITWGRTRRGTGPL